MSSEQKNAIEETLTISEKALIKMSEILKAEDNPQLKLRIYGTGGGCSGIQFGFAFEEEALEGDISLEFPIAKQSEEHDSRIIFIVIDPTTFQYLDGAHIDYFDEPERQGFSIQNVNAHAGCGGCAGGCHHD